MWFVVKRLSLGAFLIVAASGLLLYSATDRRRADSQRVPRVAVFQHASVAVLDDTVDGMIDGLAASGFVDGKTIELTKFNAQGELATANAIARDIAEGPFDMVLTASTLSLQTMANANRAGKVVHVFSAVADPFDAGVGISRSDPLHHPKHLVGQGIFLPVQDSFSMARKAFPGLKTVGVIWNPAESNSLAFTTRAREVCREMGIELLEANVDNSAGVLEAAQSLFSRGIEAVWIGGDVTVISAIQPVIAAARQQRIPVFSITPGPPDRGTLFDMGIDFRSVGLLAGELAARILRGENPAQIPVVDVLGQVPRYLGINMLVLKGLRDPWHFDAATLAEATVVVDEKGTDVRKSTSTLGTSKDTNLPLAKKWNVHLIEYVQVLDVEETQNGIDAGFRDAGLHVGSDFTLTVHNAQGDMPTIGNLVDAAVTDGADLIITQSTPTLQAAIRKARDIPIVFTYVADPVAAGAGRSDSDHLPNLTGVATSAAYEDAVTVLRQCLPNARKVGTLFVPSEVNTVYHKDQVALAAKKHGIELVAVPFNTASEAGDAALAMCSNDLDAVLQIGGNLTASSFPSIAQAASVKKLPIFAFLSSQAHGGAAVVVARDYFDAGREAALIAARIMRGEKPAQIPIYREQKNKILINLTAAKACGLTIPPALLKQADEVIGR